MKFLSLVIDLPRSQYTITRRPSLGQRIKARLTRTRRRSRPPRRRRQSFKLAVAGILATTAAVAIFQDLAAAVGEVASGIGWSLAQLSFNQAVGSLAV